MNAKILKFIVVSLIVLSLVSCGNGELPSTWYLIGPGNSGASLELHEGKAVYHNIEKFEDKEFEYVLKDDTLVLTSIGQDEELKIEFTIKDSYDYGKILFKDDSIYAFEDKEAAEKYIEEEEKLWESLSQS